MSKVKDENFITIMGWMVNQLNLKGNELLIYALIYGFSQAENQTFSGSLQYMADWTNTTRQSVINALKSLQEKGLIEKTENIINGVKFCEYQSKNLTGVVKNFDGGSQKSLLGGSQKSLPNNIDNNTDKDTINDNIRGGNNVTSTLPHVTKFKVPSIEEVKAYCQERQNNVDPERFIDYYSANGWKVGKNPMKDWKAAVRTWEKNGYSSKKAEPTYQTMSAEEKAIWGITG